MNFEKYTDSAKNFIQIAQTIAICRGHQKFLPEHILKALLDDKDKFIVKLIKKCGGNISIVIVENELLLARVPKVTKKISGQLYIDSTLLNFFDKVEQISHKTKDNFVTVENILLGLLLNDNSDVSRLLKKANVKINNLKKSIIELHNDHKVNGLYLEEDYNALQKYTYDLTQNAKNGKFDPVIGRDEEIRRLIQVLSRRTKNNPILIGEPGVGKTAIAEGLAIRIINKDVPESLCTKRLLSLDVRSLIAGAKYKGEFEKRLKAILNSIIIANGKIILFVDEIHTLIGVGKTDGVMNASNLLKPILARGDLHCIGVTTLDEYKKYIEKDAVFARRFQPVIINEPTIIDTISILRGLKDKYELYHGIRIADQALISAATLSHRYISNRFLPDKAIDLMDEAASCLRIQVESKPEELDELDRKIIQFKIEREALLKEKDSISIKKLNKLNKELLNFETKSIFLTKRWINEKKILNDLKLLKEKLENAKLELSIAQIDSSLEKASRLVYSVIPDLKIKIENQLIIQRNQINNKLVEEVVTAINIADIVSRWTGIPINKILSTEQDKLIKMERILRKRVIGQNDVIFAVSAAVRRARAGLNDLNKPIGSFLFLGPTGVGKTELVKSLAHFMFDDENAICRLDMSEYMEKDSISRLIGAPPGCIGYEEGGTLTESMRMKPYQIILFDEIEKAHFDIFNILLQVFDSGRLTDSKGRVIDFKNCIIILTSNLGSEFFLIKKNDYLLIKKNVLNVVKNFFRPEFINRLDEILVFNRLKKIHINKIVNIQLFYLINLLKKRNIILSYDDNVKIYLSDIEYSFSYGARPLKRVIQKYIQNPLSDLILANKIDSNQTIHIKLKNNNLVFNCA